MSVQMARGEKRRHPPRLGANSVLKQTVPLMIRVTESQKRAFEKRAKIHGLTVSAWARMILLRQVTVDEVEA